MFDLSIIIPTRNHGDALLKALMGIERATHASFEAIVIVDGPSTAAGEGVLALARSVFGNRLRVIRQATALGFSDSCNKAIGIASGRNVCILRDDVHPLEGALDAAIDQLDDARDQTSIIALLAEPAVGAELATTLEIDDIAYATSHVRGTLVADFPLARRQTFAELPFNTALKTSAATVDFSLRAWASDHAILGAKKAALISHETRLRDEQDRIAETQAVVDDSTLPASNSRFNAKSPCTLGRSTLRKAA